MKFKIFATIGLFFFLLSAYGQTVPQGMKYQAVARDNGGQVIANQLISLQVKLHAPDSKAKPYSEFHQVITNNLGLFNLTIGQGRVETGSFSDIPWSTEAIWMEVSIDENGGNDFAVISNSELLAVPYAFHALSASAISGENGTKNGNTGNTWKVGGNILNVPGPHTLGTKQADDLVLITNDIARLTITADGDIDIANSLSVGEDLTVVNDVFLNTNLSGSTINNGDFTVANSSATDLTGTLNVNGATDLNSTLEVDGATDLNTTLNVDGATDLNSTLEVDGTTDLNSSLEVDGTTDLNSTLEVDGATDLNSTLNVDGTTALKGQVTIDATVTGGESSFGAYPLRVQGSDQGIAVKLNGNIPHRSQNYITFFDGGTTPRGRIEGFDFSQDNATIARSFLTAALPIPGTPAVGNNGNGALSWNTSDAPDALPAALQSQFTGVFSSLNSDYGYGLVSETIDLVNSITQAIINIAGCAVLVGCDDLVSAAVDVIAQGVQLSLHIFYFGYNEGVAFESGGADYAEWLQKANMEELIAAGDVVGVIGGEISKDFTHAEKFMVVSGSPTVIGAMPDPEQGHLYEKIAFMGQVPVKVIGVVKKGDYILPSGNGDGLAIAVNPEEMKAKDYNRIIGIAWGEADGEKVYEYVNTAVGINSNDLADLVEQMQGVLNELQIAMQEVNPNFQPSLYEVAGDVQFDGSGYTTAPTLNEVINQKFDVSNYANTEVALQGLQEQALAQGFDMNDFPYLSEIFANPGDAQTLEDAFNYYTAASVRLQALMQEMTAARNN